MLPWQFNVKRLRFYVNLFVNKFIKGLVDKLFTSPWIDANFAHPSIHLRVEAVVAGISWQGRRRVAWAGGGGSGRVDSFNR